MPDNYVDSDDDDRVYHTYDSDDDDRVYHTYDTFWHLSWHACESPFYL